MKKLIILGAGGHGSVVADAARKSGYSQIAFLDDANISSCLGYPVVGKIADAGKYPGCVFFVALGNARTRQAVSEELLSIGAELVNVIHPTAVIAAGVTLGKGVLLAAGSIVNPNVTIGNGVIINTAASVDHDCVVGEYCHISVGARLAGNVRVEDHTWIGIGAVVSNGISVCANCMIGAGATVVKNLTESGTYVGTPARLMD